MTRATTLTISGLARIEATTDGVPDLPGVLTVKLVSTTGEVLAATAIGSPNGPIAYELVVDAELAAKRDQLRLWAMLRTDQGIWGTPALVGVDDDLTLRRVDY